MMRMRANFLTCKCGSDGYKVKIEREYHDENVFLKSDRSLSKLHFFFSFGVKNQFSISYAKDIPSDLISGHGCFNAYLKRFKKRDDESRRNYGSLVENAKHTLFVCARWGAEREAVGRAVGAQLTPDTMVSLMLQSEQIWMLIESFVTLVMKTRELDGLAERGNNGGQ